MSAQAEIPLPVVRTALLLAGVSVSGLLTSYAIFGNRAPAAPAPEPVPMAQPVAVAPIASGAWVHGPDIPPIPATAAQRRAAARALRSKRVR